MTTVGPVGTGSGAVVGPTPGASGRSAGAAAGADDCADEADGEAVWPRTGKAATAALSTSKIAAAYREDSVRRDRSLILQVREFPKDATADRLTQMWRLGKRARSWLRGLWACGLVGWGAVGRDDPAPQPLARPITHPRQLTRIAQAQTPRRHTPKCLNPPQLPATQSRPPQSPIACTQKALYEGTLLPRNQGDTANVLQHGGPRNLSKNYATRTQRGDKQRRNLGDSFPSASSGSEWHS